VFMATRTVVAAITIISMLHASTGIVSAFHSGGAGECDGCHTMHNSSGGMPVTFTSPIGSSGPFLLKGNDTGSVCLNCHQQSGAIGPAGYSVSTAPADMPPGSPPLQLTPGGDFGWLKKSYTWVPAFGAAPLTSSGDSHGHSINALDYGYLSDPLKAAAPGGSYPSSSLTCISCHDPHGRYRRNFDGSISQTGYPITNSGSLLSNPLPSSLGSVGVYRLLGGTGYRPRSLPQAVPFANQPPIAVSPDTFNRSEATAQTRVAYGSGMSEWCHNCHPAIHTDAAPTPLRHASGNSAILTSTYIDRYNRYLKTGDLTGVESTSYLSLVPFEVGTSDTGVLKGILASTPAKGPSSADGTPRVMCLSCHRAHATAWDSATRWNSKSQWVAYNGSYDQAGEIYQPYGQGRSQAEAKKGYYDIPATLFAPQQEGLCFKCHESLP